LFCMQVREVRIDGCDVVFLAKSKDGIQHLTLIIILEDGQYSAFSLDLQM
jgi:hypothetical protein